MKKTTTHQDCAALLLLKLMPYPTPFTSPIWTSGELQTQSKYKKIKNTHICVSDFQFFKILSQWPVTEANWASQKQTNNSMHQQTRELISAQKTSHKQQRPESPTATLTWDGHHQSHKHRNCFKCYCGESSERWDGAHNYALFWAHRYYLELNWTVLKDRFHCTRTVCTCNTGTMKSVLSRISLKEFASGGFHCQVEDGLAVNSLWE